MTDEYPAHMRIGFGHFSQKIYRGKPNARAKYQCHQALSDENEGHGKDSYKENRLAFASEDQIPLIK
ncbi:MAG: hypothetical protein M3Q07_21965 [Pseudobdellovibrionaceae bacterium]|nr:hypothetical protein [Pseudobdellovibrionaceae bacterium]